MELKLKTLKAAVSESSLRTAEGFRIRHSPRKETCWQYRLSKPAVDSQSRRIVWIQFEN